MDKPDQAPIPLHGGTDGHQDQFLSRIGQMTRSLHDNLRGLGFDRLLEKAASDMPDARDRLEYVAMMTEKAAQRVLNATEIAGPLQDRIGDEAENLAAQWKSVMGGAFSEAEFRAMAEKTQAFLSLTSGNVVQTKQQLLDIMMAQDFQDLSGQVINKVTDILLRAEAELRHIVEDELTGADEGEAASQGHQLEGVQVPDRAMQQDDVDDLLASLGF